MTVRPISAVAAGRDDEVDVGVDRVEVMAPLPPPPVITELAADAEPVSRGQLRWRGRRRLADDLGIVGGASDV